jgi:hypothetical protein
MYFRNYLAFPTFASCLGQEETSMNAFSNPHIPTLELHTILHGEEKLHMIHRQLENGGTYKIRSRIIDIIDKGDKKGAVLIFRITGYLVN